jgi:hypothetical protein
MSPFGLPAAGYPASARWHVFRFQVSGFRSPLFLPTPENSAGSPSERLKTCEIPNIKKIFQIMKKSVLFQDGF